MFHYRLHIQSCPTIMWPRKSILCKGDHQPSIYQCYRELSRNPYWVRKNLNGERARLHRFLITVSQRNNLNKFQWVRSIGRKKVQKMVSVDSYLWSPCNPKQDERVSFRAPTNPSHLPLCSGVSKSMVRIFMAHVLVRQQTPTIRPWACSDPSCVNRPTWLGIGTARSRNGTVILHLQQTSGNVNENDVFRALYQGRST